MNNLIFLPFKNFYSDRSLKIDVIFFSTLFILLPIVLITGPALPDIFLSLIASYFLFVSIRYKKWHYYQNPIFFGFIIFSIYGVARSVFSDIPIDSLSNEGSMFYFRYIFFALGVWYLHDVNPHISRCFLVVSILSILIVCTDGLYQYIYKINLFGNLAHAPSRLTGFFGKEPIIGRYVAYLSIFTFALIYQNFEKTKKVMILSVAFLVISEVIVFLSGERAPLFYVSLFTFLVIIFIPYFRLYRIVGLLVSVITIYAILQINPAAKERMLDKTIDQVSNTKLPFLPYGPHHEEHYLSAFKMFADKPIFGIGTNTFRYHCNKEEFKITKRSCSSHPHHIYIQALAELGIFGFLFLVFFYLYLTYIGIKQLFFTLLSNQKKKIPFEYLLYPMILFVYWWPLVPHMSLYNNWNNVFMMLPLGYLMRYLYNSNVNGYFNKN